MEWNKAVECFKIHEKSSVHQAAIISVLNQKKGREYINNAVKAQTGRNE